MTHVLNSSFGYSDYNLKFGREESSSDLGMIAAPSTLGAGAEIVQLSNWALFGGGYGYQRRTDWGRGPVSLFGILLVIVVVILLFRVL